MPGETKPLTEEEQKKTWELFSKRNKAINMSHFDARTKTWCDYWYNFKHWVYDHNPFNKYCHVGSIDELTAMPRRQKHTFLFWYNDPTIRGDGSSARFFLGRKRDREALEAYMRKKYFIQYPLRQWAFKVKCCFSRYWDEVCYFLNPRQKWLRKKIPNGWCDKTHLIPLINFAIVVDFVENESAMESIDWETSSTEAGQFEKELKECYDYIKTHRPTLEERIQNSYPDEDAMTGDFNVDYAENNRLEIELNEKDTKYLTWIVVNRDFFWT